MGGDFCMEQRLFVKRLVEGIGMKSNIVLIGMPGAGKSTVGVVLAKRMGYRFVDSDLVIQEKYGKLLHELIENRGSIVTRDALMDALWNTNEFVSDNTLNVLMSRLRAKLKEITDVDVILTKKGQGYYIE